MKTTLDDLIIVRQDAGRNTQNYRLFEHEFEGVSQASMEKQWLYNGVTNPLRLADLMIPGLKPAFMSTVAFFRWFVTAYGEFLVAKARVDPEFARSTNVSKLRIRTQEMRRQMESFYDLLRRPSRALSIGTSRLFLRDNVLPPFSETEANALMGQISRTNADLRFMLQENLRLIESQSEQVERERNRSADILLRLFLQARNIPGVDGQYQTRYERFIDFFTESPVVTTQSTPEEFSHLDHPLHQRLNQSYQAALARTDSLTSNGQTSSDEQRLILTQNYLYVSRVFESYFRHVEEKCTEIQQHRAEFGEILAPLQNWPHLGSEAWKWNHHAAAYLETEVRTLDDLFSLVDRFEQSAADPLSYPFFIDNSLIDSSAMGPSAYLEYERMHIAWHYHYSKTNDQNWRKELLGIIHLESPHETLEHLLTEKRTQLSIPPHLSESFHHEFRAIQALFREWSRRIEIKVAEAERKGILVRASTNLPASAFLVTKKSLSFVKGSLSEELLAYRAFVDYINQLPSRWSGLGDFDPPPADIWIFERTDTGKLGLKLEPYFQSAAKHYKKWGAPAANVLLWPAKKLIDAMVGVGPMIKGIKQHPHVIQMKQTVAMHFLRAQINWERLQLISVELQEGRHNTRSLLAYHSEDVQSAESTAKESSNQKQCAHAIEVYTHIK